MALILFLFKMMLVSGILFTYYWLFLRNEKFHIYNRFYLLSIPLLSIIIPLMNIPMPNFFGTDEGTGVKLLKVVNGNWEEAVVLTGHKPWWPSIMSWQNIGTALYCLIALFILISTLISILYVLRLTKKYDFEKINEIKLYETPEPGTPFSFLRHIFWNSAIDMNSTSGKQIFRHELYHVKQKHTSDILFMESLTMLFWFNPFFHWIKKEIKTVHEFLADQYAVSEANRYDYAELLVWQSYTQKHLNLINPFFHNQIKRRITMITQLKNSRYGYISRLMALPLLFLLFCAFGKKMKNIHNNHLSKVVDPITVIIDPGYGGDYEGTRLPNGVSEKALNLSIAKQIKRLGKDYNVNVILTREKDEVVGNANTLKEDLLNRVRFTETNKAVAFISIHVNGDIQDQSPKNGFEIYVSNKNS